MRLAISPIDTWFFGDGTPYDKGASPQAGVIGVFPPYPPTVAGAIRTALALRNGWDGRAKWSREMEAVLGTGPEDLGNLRITGPFVLEGRSPVFPLPRHVVGRFDDDGRWQPVALLRPGRPIMASDLGRSVRFPEATEARFTSPTKPLVPSTQQWVTLSGLERILRGQLPTENHLLGEPDLWTPEPRVGIARQSSSLTVAEGALYSSRHVRPRPSVSIGMEVNGVPESWRSPAGSVFPFGGESRLAACEEWNAEVRIDALVGESSTVVLVPLTPALIERDILSGKTDLPIEGARIVSACTDRPLRIGGWDSMRRAPLPMKNAVAPGSTLFCEIDRPDVFRNALSAGLLRIGGMTEAGFGLCAVGNAPSWEKTL